MVYLIEVSAMGKTLGYLAEKKSDMLVTVNTNPFCAIMKDSFIEARDLAIEHESIQPIYNYKVIGYLNGSIIEAKS